MWFHVNSRTSEPPVAMMTHTLGNQETRARPFLLTPGSHEPAYTGAHHTHLPTLGHTLRPWASCRTCEYFMSGAGGCFSCSHTSHPPFHRLLFICLMNYLSVAPLPSRPPLPPGPRLHDLLNTAQLCGCHPKSQEPCWATELESSFCPRPVQPPASLAPGAGAETPCSECFQGPERCVPGRTWQPAVDWQP